MDWKVIRAAFIRARGRRTQWAVAEKGGLLQPAISKLEANDNLGPAVGVFVKAVEGLGLRPSEFFAQIERQTDTDSTTSTVGDRKAPIQFLKGGPPHGADPDVSSEQLADVLEEASRILKQRAAARAAAATRAATKRRRARRRPRKAG